MNFSANLTENDEKNGKSNLSFHTRSLKTPLEIIARTPMRAISLKGISEQSKSSISLSVSAATAYPRGFLINATVKSAAANRRPD